MEPTAETDEPGPVESAVTMLRLLAGWAATGLAVLNLGMGVDLSLSSPDGPYLLFHLALLIAGLGLLGFGLLHKRPGRAAWLTLAAVTAGGLALSTLPRTGPGCCLREYPERHGIPFTLLAGDAGRWHFAPGHLVVDLIFWASLGFCGLLLVTLLRPAAPPSSPQSSPPAVWTPQHATHAEHRAPAPDDENVGGLP